MVSNKLRLWEAALFLAFGLTLTVGVWSSASASALAGQVLRLHVVANSDSQQDQALKLQVRDAVLAQASPLLEGVTSQAQAEEVLTPHLEELGQTARAVLDRAGCQDTVTVCLENQWFPTKVYDGFSLPAGTYRALRIVIGEGRGQNWWCVVFPPLCLASVTEEVASTAAQAGLSEDQVSLITGQDGGYVLKFKLMEWWDSLLQSLGLS
ncbi:MAG TPA: stage II sporulation protein R [Candidatus Enterenecus stercoripullorum]|nr:stage II sporulation protein R [Candidatus Enterenecus stercoripullorum]